MTLLYISKDIKTWNVKSTFTIYKDEIAHFIYFFYERKSKRFDEKRDKISSLSTIWIEIDLTGFKQKYNLPFNKKSFKMEFMFSTSFLTFFNVLSTIHPFGIVMIK